MLAGPSNSTCATLSSNCNNRSRKASASHNALAECKSSATRHLERPKDPSMEQLPEQGDMASKPLMARLVSRQFCAA